MPHGPERADERPHTPGPGPRWCERYEFEFHSPKATFGGHIGVWLWPAHAAWYWAGVVEEGRPLISIVDTEVPLPRSGLELRSSGLWADHIAETPLAHWSVGLEAFAVRLDDPTDVFGAFRGERVPLGFDLEWEARIPPGAAEAELELVPGGYVQACAVHGEVLIGADHYELTGAGRRSHVWGDLVPAPPDAPWPAGGLPALDDAGGVEGAEVVVWSPARLPLPGGGAVEEARALCRTAGGDVGWRHFARIA
jgi:hypothetical protein